MRSSTLMILKHSVGTKRTTIKYMGVSPDSLGSHYSTWTRPSSQ